MNGRKNILVVDEIDLQIMGLRERGELSSCHDPVKFAKDSAEPGLKNAHSFIIVLVITTSTTDSLA